MRAEWVSSSEAQAYWPQLPYASEPFSEWEWWSRLGLSWGALLIETNGTLIAGLPLAYRQIGPLHLYRQPLGSPWSAFRLHAPLPEPKPERYRLISHVLSAIAAWVRRRHLSYVAGHLSPEWSYLPPLRHLQVRGSGSFIIEPGAFVPSQELLRKVRQAHHFPLRSLAPAEGFTWWAAHRPPGVSSQLAAQLRQLIQIEGLWQVLGIGEPLEAVCLLLIGKDRVWYMAGAQRRTPQAMTRLLYEAILFAQNSGKVFDFCGSILPGVERFFRQYGGRWECRYFVSAWRVW
ncbi:MAG: hypothetical protein RMK19_04200 [Bacteroidia bacterium]|nr:hypothetical protein [Bacteroidia bacterium]MDW8015193.1 hypothetical protein [Bacteroidia bacterium]